MFLAIVQKSIGTIGIAVMLKSFEKYMSQSARLIQLGNAMLPSVPCAHKFTI